MYRIRLPIVHIEDRAGGSGAGGGAQCAGRRAPAMRGRGRDSHWQMSRPAAEMRDEDGADGFH